MTQPLDNINLWPCRSNIQHSKVSTSSDVCSVGNVISYISDKSIDLKYIQRCRKPSWDLDEQSKFIESLIIGFPTPPLYFNVSDNTSWAVIDGLERLIALKSFITDKNLKISKVEFLHHLEGKYFTDLQPATQRRLLEATIFVIRIAEVGSFVSINSIYQRLNRKRSNTNRKRSNTSDFELIFAQATPKTWEFFDKFKPQINSIFCNKLDGHNPYIKILDFFKSLRIHQSFCEQSAIEEKLQRNAAIYDINNFDDRSLNELGKLFNKAFDRFFSIYGKYQFETEWMEKGIQSDLHILFDVWMPVFAIIPNNKWGQVKLHPQIFSHSTLISTCEKYKQENPYAISYYDQTINTQRVFLTLLTE